ncbi:hypothetical protein QFC22_001039 [Naganishia vaughanmartiniae]|uniref:Uncharacterized protein n=1 Tax=Naganishia vaughanmartiniae TaxID=1424756 RepID=A0ACC2XJP8_9TREE|nr:hypothetical protein QFC22_001039 [Naganishia vaughanmartiniae]
MPTVVRMRNKPLGQKVNLVTKKQTTITTPTAQQQTAPAQQHGVKSAIALAHDQALMNLQQSNLIVKTMLDATFGCMTFLRGLLPDGNFEDVHIAAPNPGLTPLPGSGRDARAENGDASAPPASQMSVASQGGVNGGESQSKHGKGLRIKKIKRGYSTEADKLLDWINLTSKDGGVIEAVEKQYLKSCVFAVYLDPEDPTNLVEALTINFYYPEIGNSGTRIPQFDIEDSIQNLRIGGTAGLMIGGSGTGERAALGDSRTGNDGMRLRTIGEVKKAIKKLVKSLIITCQSLGELPTRRWVTMRLHYLDGTPADYEPPFFVSADTEQDLHFGTKNSAQIPDKTSVGHLETGFHSMSLKLTSIADYLPRVLDVQEEENCYGGFSSGTDASHNLGKRRRAEETVQRSDAAKRRVIWNALEAVEDRADIDPAYQDAEGEPDSQIPTKLPQSPSSRPTGIRQADGMIIPYSTPLASTAPKRAAVPAKDVRSSQLEPTYVSRDRENIGGATQATQATQELDWPMENERREEERSARANQPNMENDMMDMQSDQSNGGKTVAAEDSIGSFSHSQNNKSNGAEGRDIAQSKADQDSPGGASEMETNQKNAKSKKSKAKYQTCPCAAKKEDEVMVQCEDCVTWYHIPCAGTQYYLDWVSSYLEEKDLPDKFYCIVCKMKAAGHFSKAKIDEVQSYLPSLTLERRALKKIYKKTKFDSKHMTRMMTDIGCDANDFRRLVERLLELGFIKKVATYTTRNGKKTTTHVYHAQVEACDMKRYTEYFEPGGEIELKAVGITADMLTRNYAVQAQKSKKVASSPEKNGQGKENVAPQTQKTRNTAPKTLPLATAPAMEQTKSTGKGAEVETAKEITPRIQGPAATRTEVPRLTIPLPKIKPRQKPGNQPITGQSKASGLKALFRTAASVMMQPPVEEEDRIDGAIQNPQASKDGGAGSRGNRASAPEEDVDMGV